MARLSAHGIEIARIGTVRPIGEDGIERSETSYSYRSDGYILKRIVIIYEDGKRRDLGWKLRSKLKDAKRDTDARMLDIARRQAARFAVRGFRVTASYPGA